MDKDFLVLLNISTQNLENKDSFRRYLREAGANKRLMAKALQIYSAKKKFKGQEKLIEKFIELSAYRSMDKKMTAQKYKDLYSYLRFVENISPQSPLRLLVELGVALKTNNHEWVGKLSKKLINSSTYQFAVYIEPRTFDQKLYLQFVNALFDTLETMKKTHPDQMLSRMLSTKLNFYLPQKEKKRFNSEFNGNWSLNELREIVSTRKYGQAAIGLWFNILENRTTEAEVISFLNRVMKRGALTRLPYEEFWILKYFYPGDERRKTLDNRLTQFVKKESSIHQGLILSQILEKEAIQKTLGKVNPKYNKALFKLKRDIFRDVLESGNPSQFALYNLFLLGEKDPELFWWFVL